MLKISNFSNDLLSDYRYEIKLPLEKVQFENLKQYLYQLGLFPVTAYPDRTVNSIYYDTRGLYDYHSNVSGVAERSKKRIRWYDGDVSKLRYEKKIKQNKASRKESVIIKNELNIMPDTPRKLEQLLSQLEHSAEKIELELIEPILEVQYQRQYFLLHQDLRMTIDLEQKFRRLTPIADNIFIRSPVYAVVEFKFPANIGASMKSLLGNLPFRLFRHSKYVIGVEASAY
jgi:SPX domain protein involved in polyphosphate accumulation